MEWKPLSTPHLKTNIFRDLITKHLFCVYVIYYDVIQMSRSFLAMNSFLFIMYREINYDWELRKFET